MFELLFALYASNLKHGESECDVHLDKLNKTFPFVKFDAIVENKDVVLNRKLKHWEW